MKAVIYMRVGNPDQVAVQHRKEKLPGQIQGTVGGNLKRDGFVGNNIPSLQEFLQEIRGYDRHNNLTLIHRQFCPNLALANHTPHEVMRVPAIFTLKKVKKVCDNNLPLAGYGRININGTFETLARL